MRSQEQMIRTHAPDAATVALVQNAERWPFAMLDEPRYAVSKERFAPVTYLTVAFLSWRACPYPARS